MDTTLKYYEINAEKFIKSTISVDFKDIQDRFLASLPGLKILDFGCGSGRDTKYFLNAGLDVSAIDGSAELCRIASEYTGINVRCMLFEELSELAIYDGIWSCASILHLSKKKLHEVLIKMSDALKDHGIIYTSFKYGNFEGERNGRYFTDFTLESFEEYIQNVPMLQIEECWITGDARLERGEEKWLNLILRKMDQH